MEDVKCEMLNRIVFLALNQPLSIIKKAPFTNHVKLVNGAITEYEIPFVYLRTDLKAALNSLLKVSGCSQAAK